VDRSWELLLVVIDFPDCVIDVGFGFVDIELEFAGRRSLQGVLEPLWGILEFVIFLLLQLWLLGFLFFEFADLRLKRKVRWRRVFSSIELCKNVFKFLFESVFDEVL
jgi:hypothetical protein